MYRNGRRAFGDVVIASEENAVIPHAGGVVANADSEWQAAYDLQQTEFGDVVVPHPEGIVTNTEAGAAGYDVQQDQFADDLALRDLSYPVGGTIATQLMRVRPAGAVMFGDGAYASPSEIGGGDDGLGVAAARRLKHRIKGKRMRLGTARVEYYNYPQVFRYGTGDTLYDPYGFGFRLRLPKFIRKFKFGRFLRRTALPVAGYAAGGFLAFKGLKAGVGALRKIKLGGGGAGPVPGPAIDAEGGIAPQEIAFTPTPSPVGGREAPTASEEVATAADEAGGGQETVPTTGPAGTEEGTLQAGLASGLGGFGPILLIGAGLFLVGQLLPGRKAGGRRRR